MNVIRILTTHSLPMMAVSCAVFASPAMAETSSTPTESSLPTIVVNAKKAEPSYQVKVSSTATKTAAQLHDVPQTVSVVNKTVMRDQNAASVQDALINVPGLSASVGDGQRDQTVIRGFLNITDQFVDGVRDDALYFRDLSNIEQIEVLKGPAAVVYGRGSAGGIVNRVTKKPSANPVEEVGVTFGSRGQKRGEFDLGTTTSDKDMQFRLTGAVESSSSFRDGYFLDRQAIAPSALFKISPDTTVMVQADYLHDKRLADQGVPSYHGRPVDVPIKTYYGAANGRDRAYVESEVLSSAITVDHRFSDTLKLHSVLRAYDYSLDRNYTTPTVNEKTAKVAIAETKRVRDEKGVYLQNELSQILNWGSVKHEILYGLEVGHQDKSERLYTVKNVATYNLFAPVLVDLPPIPHNTPASNDNKSQFDIYGLYLQDFVTITPEWKLLAGARFDRIEQNRDDRTKANLDLDRTDNTVSPRIGLVYQPIEAVSLYASYSKSYQPIADAFTFYANSDQLKPTETKNKEVGVKWDLTQQASLTTSLFEMSQTNIQNQDPLNPLLAVPIGEQRTRGLELSFTGKIAPQWDVLAGYSYMKSEILSSTAKTSTGKSFNGNEASLTPRNSFNLWIKHKLDDGFYVAAGAKAESSRFASADDLTTLPGYGVMNLGAGYESAKFDINATLQNVLNRKYFVAGHSGANDYNLPGAPVTLTVGARYRF
ncbi:TonB-dependent receptor [Aquirhabdus parva]|nr:TonB-dependent siderophore receptor [Aquirhabdus parva]